MDKVGLDLIKSSFHGDQVHCHVFVVLGASGDLARKKIYPTLWWLYRDRLFPKKTFFIGYARSDITVETIREKATPYMSLKKENAEEMQRFEDFWKDNSYIKGSYTETKDFKALDEAITSKYGQLVNRIFYLALPPSTYMSVASHLAECCKSKKYGWLIRFFFSRSYKPV